MPSDDGVMLCMVIELVRTLETPRAPNLPAPRSRPRGRMPRPRREMQHREETR